ncbi:MAG: hypothetical protein CL681_08010 [Blastopirellula sp.]|nr:hypothetical protein [Blastopirellula sp.]
MCLLLGNGLNHAVIGNLKAGGDTREVVVAARPYWIKLNKTPVGVRARVRVRREHFNLRSEVSSVQQRASVADQLPRTSHSLDSAGIRARPPMVDDCSATTVPTQHEKWHDMT